MHSSGGLVLCVAGLPVDDKVAHTGGAEFGECEVGAGLAWGYPRGRGYESHQGAENGVVGLADVGLCGHVHGYDWVANYSIFYSRTRQGKRHIGFQILHGREVDHY